MANEPQALTVDYLDTLLRYANEKRLPTRKGPSYVILTEQAWLTARRAKLCDFTDIEMGNAIEGNGTIKTSTFGNWGTVQMIVDRSM